MGMVSLLGRLVFCPYEPVSRYKFAPNKFMNLLACVSLETLSTESGYKDFIALGMMINRGEDLAVKGAVSFLCANHLPGSSFRNQTYVSEIVEVVPDPGSDMKCSFMLHLRCRDKAKGPRDGGVRHRWLPCVVYGPEGEQIALPANVGSFLTSLLDLCACL
jgi:hypothetical protein